MAKSKGGTSKFSSPSGKMEWSTIMPDTGINSQPDQGITEGMIQSPVAGMNTKGVFTPRNLEPYGAEEPPGARDLNLRRPSGASQGPSLKSTVEGKTGEKA